MAMANPKTQNPNPKSQIEETAEDYCRQLESYLCRKNDGHLIRIVGPAFEQVCGWSSRGIPAERGVGGHERLLGALRAKGRPPRAGRVEILGGGGPRGFGEGGGSGGGAVGGGGGGGGGRGGGGGWGRSGERRGPFRSAV